MRSDPLAESRKYWDAHARRDPLWGVLSQAGREARGWDVRRFFETGTNEVALILYRLHEVRVDVTFGSALDVGCGVGRVTRALGARFQRVVGVDVSPGMIEKANALNRFRDRVQYMCTNGRDLSILEDRTFDFVFSSIVLQHVVPDVSVQYIEEFLRVLVSRGVAVFQLPSHRRGDDDPAPEAGPISMPDDAYNATLAFGTVPPDWARPAQTIDLDVIVTNASPFPWLQQEFGTIRIGNHWLDRGGVMLVRDDGRAPLPQVLGPGETCRVRLTITAPEDEGEYVCDTDLAHEGVRWFGDRGSPTARFALRVSTESTIPHSRPAPVAVQLSEPQEVEREFAGVPPVAPGDLSVADPGDFPMYGVHTDVVCDVIAGCNGELLRRDVDRSCGDEWISYRYFVRRR